MLNSIAIQGHTGLLLILKRDHMDVEESNGEKRSTQA